MVYLAGNVPTSVVSLIGVIFAFLVTWIATDKLKDKLPRDQGRAYAQDGMKSAGKPRGAGIIFILCFVVAALIFSQINLEIAIYLVLVVIEMFTGYFDDAAEKPWGEYLKGALDLAVAIVVAIVYIAFNGSTLHLGIIGTEITLSPIVFGILTVILVWAAINVTNCSDGVDGLSASLVMITLGTFFILDQVMGVMDPYNYTMILFIACLLAYLWFNATPSILLMGDAGSRAMGIFIAIAALKCHDPLLFLLAAIVLIIDGGLGLIKVSLLRFLKIRILKNTTTPIHDHVRKRKGWSNAHVVFRFAIIQLVVSAITIYLVMI